MTHPPTANRRVPGWLVLLCVVLFVAVVGVVIVLSPRR